LSTFGAKTYLTHFEGLHMRTGMDFVAITVLAFDITVSGLLIAPAHAQDMGDSKSRLESVIMDYRRTQQCYTAHQETVSEQEFDTFYDKIQAFEHSKFRYASDIVNVDDRTKARLEQEVASGAFNAAFCKNVENRVQNLLHDDSAWQ
jgi:hypothetical protein